MLSDLFEFKLIFVRELVPFEKWYQEAIGQVGMTSLQVNCSLAEVNASVFIAVF